jgi:hypothetical protein
MRSNLASLGVVAAALALCGCTTVSNWMKPAPDVIKTGPDTYKVRAGAGGGSPSDAEVKSRGIKLAGDYCDAQNKHALIVVTGSSGWHLFSTQTPEVSFVCDDLPQVKPVPKTTS